MFVDLSDRVVLSGAEWSIRGSVLDPATAYGSYVAPPANFYSTRLRQPDLVSLTNGCGQKLTTS